MEKLCSVDGCDRQAYAWGFCNKHYQRAKKYGDPTFTKVAIGTPEERFWGHITKEAASGCWLFDSLLGSGYGTIWVRGKMVRAHRFAYELFKGRIPAGLVVRHKCRNRNCVNPDHLEIGTHRENALDRRRDGTQKEGEASTSSKLSEEEVLEIRQSTKSQRALAKRYGVGRRAIQSVLSRRTWKHLEESS